MMRIRIDHTVNVISFNLNLRFLVVIEKKKKHAESIKHIYDKK